MRKDIIKILTELSLGNKPFFEQDILPNNLQEKCSDILKKTKDIKYLNTFFEDEISPVIHHSHNTYLANR